MASIQLLDSERLSVSRASESLDAPAVMAADTFSGGLFAVPDDVKADPKTLAAPTKQPASVSPLSLKPETDSKPVAKSVDTQAAVDASATKTAEKSAPITSGKPKRAGTTSPSRWKPYVDEPRFIKLPVQPSTQEQATWNEYLSKRRPVPAAIRETVRQLMHKQEYSQVVALITAAIQHNQCQIWMYDALGIALQLQGATPEDIERALLSGLDFSSQPTDILHVARYLARSMQGNQAIERRALNLFKQAAMVAPTHPEAYVEGLALSQRLNDLEGIQWATIGILSQAWPNEYRDIPKQVSNMALATYNELAGNKNTEAQAKVFKQAMTAALERDCVVKVSWTGDADIDLLVEEPSGTQCSFRTPRTTAGGVMLGDATVSADRRNAGVTSESYVCPKGFGGTYKVTLRRVWGKSAVDRVVVDFYTHKGTPEEKHERKTLALVDGEATAAFALDKGRRTESLAEEQVANAVDSQLEVGRAILAQQMSGYDNGFGKIGSFVGSRSDMLDAFSRLGRNGVGYQPLIITLPEGANFQAVAVVSADRRYVRATTTPFFSSIPQVNTFNYATGSSGTGNGGTGGGTGGAGGTGGGTGGGNTPPNTPPSGSQLPPVLDGLIVAIAPWFTWNQTVGGFQAFNGSLVGQANNGAPGQGTNFLWSGTDDADIDHRPVRVNGGGPNGLDELRFDGQVMGMINTGPLPAGTGLDFFMLGRPALPVTSGDFVSVIADTAGFAPELNNGFTVASDQQGDPFGLNTLVGDFNAGPGALSYFGLNNSYSNPRNIILELGYTGTGLPNGATRRYRINSQTFPLVQVYLETGFGPYAQATSGGLLGGDFADNDQGLLAIGMDNNGGFPGAHRYSIILIYNRLLSTAESQQVVNWLNTHGQVF